MTAFELSERKVQFRDVVDELFEMEPDCNGRIILTPEQLRSMRPTIKEEL